MIPSSDSEADEHDDESTDNEEDDAARSSSHSGEGSATEPEDTPRTEAFDGSDAVEDAVEAPRSLARPAPESRSFVFATRRSRRTPVSNDEASATSTRRLSRTFAPATTFDASRRSPRCSARSARITSRIATCTCVTRTAPRRISTSVSTRRRSGTRAARARWWRSDSRAIATRAAAPALCKCQARAGFALVGLGNPRLAKIAFEGGLAMDPAHVECKRGLEEATAAVVADLVAGRGRETFARPPRSASPAPSPTFRTPRRCIDFILATRSRRGC